MPCSFIARAAGSAAVTMLYRMCTSQMYLFPDCIARLPDTRRILRAFSDRRYDLPFSDTEVSFRRDESRLEISLVSVDIHEKNKSHRSASVATFYNILPFYSIVGSSRKASIKPSRSPSSTAWTLFVSCLVRVSLTSVYGWST